MMTSIGPAGKAAVGGFALAALPRLRMTKNQMNPKIMIQGMICGELGGNDWVMGLEERRIGYFGPALEPGAGGPSCAAGGPLFGGSEGRMEIGGGWRNADGGSFASSTLACSASLTVG